jgi:membrane-associated phospholipid phosphatase
MLAALWHRAHFVDRLFLAWFAGVGALIAGFHPDGWPLLLGVHAAGFALVATLVAAAPRLPVLHAWYPLLMPAVTFPVTARLNLMIVPGWQDAALLAVERWIFATPPTVWLPQVTPLLLAEVFRAGYLAYFLLLLGIAGLFRWRGMEAPFRGVMAASVLAYLGCYVVFLAWPTEGPAHTLRDVAVPIDGGPLRDVVRFVQRAGVHGNAFPSTHVAGAIPPLIYAWRYAPPLGPVLAAIVVLMGLGAVHDGYHYASDVVAGAAAGAAAAAFVLAAQASPSRARRLALPPTALRQDGGAMVTLRV